MDTPVKESLKRTKIVATLGPRAEEKDHVLTLAKHGMNVARLNFSHDVHESHLKRLLNVRAVSKELNKPIAVLQDLQGPKIRLGILASEPIHLEKGQEVTLHLSKEQVDERIPVQFDIFPHLKEGDRVLINDGLIRLSVEKTGKDHAVCIVRVPGPIKSKKGVNLPDTRLPNVAFTEKDHEDLLFGLKHKVDFVALSFVQDAQDIKHLRSIIEKQEHRPKIVAKIETRECLKHMAEIVAETDAIMVARGDMAVEVGQEDVPIVQRELIKLCRRMNKPVIVATQMLESMVNSPVPTRAEVNDVASAVIDLADATMLSGETAYGDYPVEAVATMERIIKRVERHHRDTLSEFAITSLEESHDQTTAIAAASSLLANQLKAKMICVATTSGKTAQRISAYRPTVPIAAVTDDELTYNQLTLLWGVKSFLFPHLKKNETGLAYIKEQIVQAGYADTDDKIVFVTGEKPGESGGTSIMKVETV